MREIIIIDTSVLLNVLNVPGFNQNRESVFGEFERILSLFGINLLLPAAAIYEAGNHISQLSDGNLRRRYATIFTEEVQKAIAGDAPWRPIELPDVRTLQVWLADFPDFAMRGLGVGDLSIVKEFDETCRKHPRHRVRIWSLDGHLAGHDRRP